MLTSRSFKLPIFAWLVTLSGLLAPAAGWAHGGAPIEFDDCRIPVGNHWVHMTAYTPMTTDEEFCKRIPNMGVTNLVFDYESKRLRNLSVEFEITKEPEGTRVYYQEPKTHPTGSVNAVVDFNQFGAGDYLAHVQLINAGEKIDAHIPFSVGLSAGMNNALLVFVIALGIITTALYFIVPAFQTKVNSVFSSRKAKKSGYQAAKGGKTSG